MCACVPRASSSASATPTGSLAPILYFNCSRLYIQNTYLHIEHRKSGSPALSPPLGPYLPRTISQKFYHQSSQPTASRRRLDASGVHHNGGSSRIRLRCVRVAGQMIGGQKILSQQSALRAADLIFNQISLPRSVKSGEITFRRFDWTVIRAGLDLGRIRDGSVPAGGPRHSCATKSIHREQNEVWQDPTRHGRCPIASMERIHGRLQAAQAGDQSRGGGPGCARDQNQLTLLEHPICRTPSAVGLD